MLSRKDPFMEQNQFGFCGSEVEDWRIREEEDLCFPLDKHLTSTD